LIEKIIPAIPENGALGWGIANPDCLYEPPNSTLQWITVGCVANAPFRDG
jgi:hypothetical protein